MTILDELERLSKEATPGPWDARVNEFSNTARPRHIWCEYGWTGRFYGEYGSVNADFVATMRNNIEALIQVARAATSILPYIPSGDMFGAGKYSEHNLAAKDLREALEKLK